MLDRRLHIRRITPTATKLFKVLAADVGRPFTDIKLNIEASDISPRDLELEIAKVLDSLQPVEREVRDLEGRWHGLSILPYRTQDNKIDGVVLALQDIHVVKTASEQLAKSAAFFHGIIDTVREPLLVLDHEQRVVAVNESFLSTFEVSLEQTVNRLLYDLGNGQWHIPALRKLLERVLPQEEVITDFQVDHDFENIGHRTMMLNARRLVQPDQSRPMILLAIEDITERRGMIETLRASEERFRTLFNLGPVAVYYCDASGAIRNFNRHAAELWGRAPELGDTDEKFCGSHKMFRPDGTFMPHGQCPMAEVLNGTIEEARDQEVLIERPDGSRVIVVVNIRRLENNNGEIAGAINCFYDITERKQAEIALARLAAIVECSDDAIIAKNLDGVIQTWNRGAEQLFGYTEKEAVGQPITMLMPPDRVHEEPAILERIRRGEHINHYELENNPGGPPNGRDEKAWYGPSEFNTPNRISVSYVYELPFGKSKSMLQSGPLSWVLGNWRTSGVYTYYTGYPFTATWGNESIYFDPTSNGYAVAVPNVEGKVSYPKNPNCWFYYSGSSTGCSQYSGRSNPFIDPGTFVDGQGHTQANVGNGTRNALTSPDTDVFDAALMKNFPIYESLRAQLRWEVFNIANHPLFGSPGGDVSGGSGAQITTLSGDPRVMQFAFRVDW